MLSQQQLLRLIAYLLLCCSILHSSCAFSQHKQLNIAFVTGNAMKANEMNTILANHGATRNSEGSMVNLRVLTVDLPEIQGKSEYTVQVMDVH
jgi:hypothetical protein